MDTNYSIIFRPRKQDIAFLNAQETKGYEKRSWLVYLRKAEWLWEDNLTLAVV